MLQMPFPCDFNIAAGNEMFFQCPSLCLALSGFNMKIPAVHKASTITKKRYTNFSEEVLDCYTQSPDLNPIHTIGICRSA